MSTPDFFREKARECRRLLEIAVKPEVIAQLQMWIREFEEAALEAERDAASTIVIAPETRSTHDA